VRRIALTAAIIGLAGCASQSPNQTINSYYAVEVMMKQSIVADSIIRDGDVLSFSIADAPSSQVEKPAGQSSIQVEAPCYGPEVKIMYADLLGEHRIYMGGKPEYTPPSAFNQLRPVLERNHSFKKACDTVPKSDWRVVKEVESETWVLIDHASIKNENGETKFWAAYDYPTIMLDMPYNAPYAQKREHYAVNCAKQTYRFLAGYDIDGNNHVTDGLVKSDAGSEPFSGSGADYELLFTRLCESRDSIAQLKTYTPRLKAPIALELPKLSSSVLTTIASLDMPTPTKTLKYIKIGGTSTFNGKRSDLSEELFFNSNNLEQDVMGYSYNGEGYQGDTTSWRGLIPLAQDATFSSIKESTIVNSISFTGDWKTMPIGAKLSYTSQGKTTNSAIGVYKKDAVTTDCVVIREEPASTFNIALSGQSKVLACSTQNIGRERHIAYLKDYGYFFGTGIEKNDFYYDDRKLEVVTVE
jgi:hypothetical protein